MEASALRRPGYALLPLLWSALCATAFAADGAFRMVELPGNSAPAVKLAVQACVGLANGEVGGSVYTRMGDKDTRWLEELGLVPDEVLDASTYLAECVQEFPRCVRYSYADQQRLVPSILTVGAVLRAVPLDETLPVACNEPVFDARVMFRDRSEPHQATRFVYESYVEKTTGLAMINPGYDSDDPRVWDPALTGEVNPVLVDYVFSEKLFTMFLVNRCIGRTEDNALFEELIRTNPWPRPIGIYGYDNSWKLFGGYTFEAHTRCGTARNMGAIPTEVNNLSFFSTRRAPIVDPRELRQNPPQDVTYDLARTYVAFVVGDGDNVAFMLDARGRWLRDRLTDCERDERLCAPITWSISPHLPELAPDVIEWYYAKSRETGTDWFMLPPSGELYAYPSSLNAAMQERFVAATEESATLLGTSGTVHWDWFSTWKAAEEDFLPRYAEAGVVRGIFPVNVPYMLPTLTGWRPRQHFKLLPGRSGGAVVLFRPREWRGVDGGATGILEPFFVTPETMARELGDYPRGTVAYVYMTSDGGLTLSNSFAAMIEHLPPHVQLVSADAAARLALEAATSDAAALD